MGAEEELTDSPAQRERSEYKRMCQGQKIVPFVLTVLPTHTNLFKQVFAFIKAKLLSVSGVR